MLVAQIGGLVHESVENVLMFRENAGYHHFLHFQNYFHQISSEWALTLSQTTILDSFTLKEFADDNF